ncbi:MAG: hypothetical protein QOI88_1142, partial [Gammaproteobacteria bacterium]|nr:hypothetical protein [Gammaproteobacteria bacterium]
ANPLVGRHFGARSYSGNHGSISDPGPDVGIGTAKGVATNPGPDVDTDTAAGTDIGIYTDTGIDVDAATDAATGTTIATGTRVGAREDGTHHATGEIGFRHDGKIGADPVVGRHFGARSYSRNHDSTTNPDPDVDTAKGVATSSDPDVGTAAGTGIGAREDGTHHPTGEIGFRHD